MGGETLVESLAGDTKTKTISLSSRIPPEVSMLLHQHCSPMGIVLLSSKQEGLGTNDL